VAPNSIAVHQDGGRTSIAGVTYAGELLVYREGEGGEFEEDVSFRPIPIGQSNCIAAVGFSGDGRSLLFRHTDGSLQLVAAAGGGASIGWHSPAATDPSANRVEMEAASPAVECELPEASENATAERIVAVDETGERFALLDKRGVVWWVNTTVAAGEAAGADSPTAAARNFAPLERAAGGVTWLAGDPARDRIAMVSPSSVDIVPRGGMVLAEVKEGAADTADAPAPRESVAEALGDAAGEVQTLPRRGEAKAAAFDPDGGIVVAYAGGQVAGFSQLNGTWTLTLESAITKFAVAGLFAAGDRIAVADDRDLILAIDRKSGALTGFARVPAKPSALALRPNGEIMSLEWDTDSVAALTLAAFPGADKTPDTARLVTMRSLLDPESDSSMDALSRDQEDDIAVATDTRDCGGGAGPRLARLEARLLGEGSAEPAGPIAGDCEASAGAIAELLDTAEILVKQREEGGADALIEDEAFSRLLGAAAEGNVTATRILGAALARIASEHAQLEQQAIAEDALSFGTSLLPAVVK
jgi:hypothetical protein